jgi:hypothetical protein
MGFASLRHPPRRGYERGRIAVPRGMILIVLAEVSVRHLGRKGPTKLIPFQRRIHAHGGRQPVERTLAPGGSIYRNAPVMKSPHPNGHLNLNITLNRTQRAGMWASDASFSLSACIAACSRVRTSSAGANLEIFPAHALFELKFSGDGLSKLQPHVRE